MSDGLSDGMAAENSQAPAIAQRGGRRAERTAWQCRLHFSLRTRARGGLANLTPLFWVWWWVGQRFAPRCPAGQRRAGRRGFETSNSDPGRRFRPGFRCRSAREGLWACLAGLKAGAPRRFWGSFLRCMAYSLVVGVVVGGAAAVLPCCTYSHHTPGLAEMFGGRLPREQAG